MQSTWLPLNLKCRRPKLIISRGIRPISNHLNDLVLHQIKCKTFQYSQMDNSGPNYDVSLVSCKNSSEIKSHFIKITKITPNKKYVDLIV